jgi:hypothetical protein
VRCGGGDNHRLGLHDALLVKDNHVAAAGSLTAAVAAARAAGPDLPLEVEVDTLAQVEEALACGCDLLLLDNMDPATMREAVELSAGRARPRRRAGSPWPPCAPPPRPVWTSSRSVRSPTPPRRRTSPSTGRSDRD